ncbi:MAG TPA: hypothetical protein EYG85_10540 [Crocinitomix sp.]|nr:hypothetical protein [Crocinitomix sp.]
MKKNCERCGKSFECLSDDITRCHCYQIKLPDKSLYVKQKEVNDKTYNDCLCQQCLITISQQLNLDK